MTAAARVIEERQCWQAGCAVNVRLLYERAAGGWTCRMHDDDPRTAEAVQASRERGAAKAGTQSKKRLDPDELGTLQSVGDAMRQLGTIATAVAEGRLTATQGNAVTRAIQSWLRAFEAAQLEATLAEIIRLVNGKMDGNDATTVARIRALIDRAQGRAG